VLTLTVAGVWGLFGARLDFPILLDQPVGRLSPGGAADVLSQYRFLRGIEAGFGLFAIWWRKEIFTGGTAYNRLFVLTMGMGVLGRIVGWGLDGTPSWPMFVFLGVEMVGLGCICAVTRPWRGALTASGG
jgi:Domain of unknown function (DUF4345)